MEQEKQQYLQQGYDVIMDIPLLFENDLQDTVDEVWWSTHLKVYKLNV